MNVNFPLPILYVLFIWSLIWNGLALWHASRNNQRNWFVVLLVVHTAGILVCYFQNSCRMDNQEHHEPISLIIAACVPQGKSVSNKRPYKKKIQNRKLKVNLHKLI